MTQLINSKWYLSISALSPFANNPPNLSRLEMEGYPDRRCLHTGRDSSAVLVQVGSFTLGAEFFEVNFGSHGV
jgi:hypothetical protein